MAEWCDSGLSAGSGGYSEDEMSALFRTIAEQSIKMGSQRGPKHCNSLGDISNASTELDFSAASHCSSVEYSGPKASDSVANRNWNVYQEGDGELWAELEHALATLESSISRAKVTAAQQALFDERKQEDHLRAARESWAQSTKVLEEMERELGISYPSALPATERQEYQREVLTLHKCNQNLQSNVQKHQEELDNSQAAIRVFEEEKKSLEDIFLNLKRTWLSGSSSYPPSCSSRGSSSGAESPGCGSPPCVRSAQAGASPSGLPPSPSPPGCSTPQAETQRLQRCLERLKARNERLCAALERRKNEAEQISMALSRQEAGSTALHMALTYCEECEEAYSKLLSLYEARKQHAADGAGPSIHLCITDSSIASSVSSPPGGTTHTQGNRLFAEDFKRKTGAIQQKITKLKQDRAAVCVPEPGQGGEGKLSPDTGTLAGPRAHCSPSTQDTKAEKAALLLELVTVREEMWELRNAIGLMERERRSLEGELRSQSCEDLAAALVVESLREELQDWAEQQRRHEAQAQLRGGGGITGPRRHAILRELQAALQREQMLKRRVTTLRGSLDAVLTDCSMQRRQSREEAAHLASCHSKATSSYRNVRRKYHKQLWRLERQMAVMAQRHVTQEAELKAALEALEGKREETVL